MPNWYLGKIRYQKEQENGSLKTINEAYLIDAVSYTDAEARLYKVMADNTPDFTVQSIGKMRLSDVFHFEGGDNWYKAKTIYVSIDEKNGKEKKVTNYMLVNAETAKEGIERIDESLKTMLVPFEVTDINLTTILDVFPYEADETTDLPPNFKPIAELRGELAAV